MEDGVNLDIGHCVQLDVAEEVRQGEGHVRTQLQNTEVLTAWEILRRLSLATKNPVQHQVLLSVYIFVVKLPYILRISFKRPTTKFGPNSIDLILIMFGWCMQNFRTISSKYWRKLINH